MDIPNRIKIGWREYNIKIREPDFDLIHEGQECYGQIKYQRNEILLNSLYPEDQQKTTLIHETLHGLDGVYGIGLDEKQVEQLGNALMGLIVDNPNLF